MGFVDGLEKAFDPIAGFFRKRWLKALFWGAVVVYLIIVAGPIFGGWWLYDLIQNDLLNTGAFANPYFLRATTVALTMVSVSFLPTILGLWLRLKQRIASAITGIAFTSWIVFLGVLSGYGIKTPFNPLKMTGASQCNYFVNAEGKLALRPKAYLVDPITGEALRPVDSTAIRVWQKQNPGEIPSCSPGDSKASVPPKSITIVDARHTVWFGPDGARIWYARDKDGTFRYYDGPGVDEISGDDLMPVTPDIVYQAKQMQDSVDKQARAARNEEAKKEAAIAAKDHAAMERGAIIANTERDAAQRQQSASAAVGALDAGEYDQALIDCPNIPAALQNDPCSTVRQQALMKKADQLARQSQEEVQQYRLDDAVRDAEQALGLDPSNDRAKKALRYARILKQQSRVSSPR